MTDPLRLGSWVRTGGARTGGVGTGGVPTGGPGAGGITGLVVRVSGDDVTVFEPGERRTATVPAADAQPVPAAAVRVTVTADLPLPHGVGEETLRRWLAVLTDPVLRTRAVEVLTEAGLDPAPGLPPVEMALSPAAGEDAVCLCGASTPSDGDAVACATCDRLAVPPPR